MVRRVSCILILSIAFTIMVAPGFANAQNLSVANEAYSNSYTKKVIARVDEKLLKDESGSKVFSDAVVNDTEDEVPDSEQESDVDVNVNQGNVDSTGEDGNTFEGVSKLSARLYSSTAVLLSWTKKNDADGYNIYEKFGKEYVEIDVVNNNKKVSCLIKNVRKGRTHIYAVKTFVFKKGKKEFSKACEVKFFVPNKLTRRTPGFAATTAGKMLGFAKTKLGKQYVSGGSGPNYFDCSGYVYYVSKMAGTKKFSRTTAAAMWNKLRKYSIGSRSYSKAQPGDIVFFSHGSRVSHVAFYYGDNKLIHATNPRKDVAITQAAYFGRVVGIVRLPNM